MLELAVSLSNSDAADLYWMDPAAGELRLFNASSVSEDSRIPRVSPETSQEWLEGLLEPVVLHPVDAQCGSLLVLPLRSDQRLAGLLRLSRGGSHCYDETTIAVVSRLAEPLLAAMKERERDRELDLLRQRLRSVRYENSVLEKKLAERKVVERAKGILQSEYRWSEEDAYYHIRRTSRQQRIPMAVIAQRIIDVSVAQGVGRERLLA